MRVEDFNYDLPSSLIAQYPSRQRGDSRLMVIDRRLGTIEHRAFRDIRDYLTPGDLLVLNDTRVLPARLVGKKETGGKVEVLLIPPTNGAGKTWDCLIKGAGRAKPGLRIRFEQDLYGEVEEIKDGRGRIRFPGEEDRILDILNNIGHIPLPPYIKRQDEPQDKDRYQTIFAQRGGAIAAPTAGLHFTSAVLQSLRDYGVAVRSITLHIGIGTFSPVKAENTEDHRMEAEWVEIPEEVARSIQETKSRGGRVVAVGTTTTRSLESFSGQNGGVNPGRGTTLLFICPPYRFRVIDCLLTNFHLPKSTLIMLVSAFAGKELLMEAYRVAIERRYRFYSYGDAMLII